MFAYRALVSDLDRSTPSRIVFSRFLRVGGLPDGLSAGGALLLRGAGCTVNDLWDRKLDKKVARTANRPLARGAVSPRGAVAALAAQLTAGLAILTQLNPFSIALGAASLPLVVAYPLAKRVTDWVRGGGGFREC